MLPKLAAREGQLKELLLRKEVLTDLDKAKIDKLTEKIKVDYARADEWSNQKEQLTKKLWRSVVAHQRRLNQEVEKISPVLIKQVEDTLPSQLHQQGIGSLGGLTSSASLPAILANLKSPSVESDAFLSSAAGLKRKHGASSHLGRDSPQGGSHKSRHSSSDRMASPSLLTPSSSANAFLPSTSHPNVSKKALKNSGLSSMLSKVASSADLDGDLDADAEADGDGTGDGEKDTKLYCHCQRVSFGEVRIISNLPFAASNRLSDFACFSADDWVRLGRLPIRVVSSVVCRAFQASATDMVLRRLQGTHRA